MTANGKKAEILSVKFLEKKEYKILATNWRYSHLEVDIIAENQEFIVFVEVKARQNNSLNFNEIISVKKQKNIINAAEKYVEKYKIDKDIRFDVIIVNQNKLEHIEAAFYPEVE